MKKIINLIIVLSIAYWGSINAQSSVTGTIKTVGGNAVKNVSISVLNVDQESVAEIISTDGTFDLGSIAAGAYTLSFSKEGNDLDGVSTLDLVLMVKHILGIMPLNSIYAILAMDVNGNGSVTTIDLVLSRKLILGINTTFPAGNWTFLEALDDPTDLNATIELNTISITVDGTASQVLDIIGVKIGDVNGNASGE